MTRRYEVMVIYDPSLGDEEITKEIGKVEELVTSSQGGEMVNLDKWGKKRLAYEIKGKQFGFYVVFEFNCPPDLPKEIDRVLRLNNAVVRHMVLSIPEKVLKLKERENELKANLEARRKKMAEEADDAPVVDMLAEKEGDDSEEVEAEQAAEATEGDDSEQEKPDEKADEAGEKKE